VLFGPSCHCPDCAKYDLKLKSLNEKLKKLQNEKGRYALGTGELQAEIELWKLDSSRTLISLMV
jgi:hypothetical protein